MSADTDTKASTRPGWAPIALAVALLVNVAVAITLTTTIFWMIAELHEAVEALSVSTSIMGSAFAYGLTGQGLDIERAAGLPLSFTIFRLFAFFVLTLGAACLTLTFYNNREWLDSTDRAYEVMDATGPLCLLTWSILVIAAFVVVLA